LPLSRPHLGHAAAPSSLSRSHAAAPASGREREGRDRERGGGRRRKSEGRRVAAALESGEDWGFGSREMKTCLVDEEHMGCLMG
jgi:hypothetical protein